MCDKATNSYVLDYSDCQTYDKPLNKLTKYLKVTGDETGAYIEKKIFWNIVQDIEAAISGDLAASDSLR